MKRLLVLVLLLSGCSLPLPGGVKTVEGVPAEQQQPGGGVRVVPPGPRPGQTPEDVVRGFLQAEASADGSHAIARSYLTPAQATAWDDRAGVRVYELRSLATSLTGSEADSRTVTVTAQVTAVIDSDGGYRPAAAEESEDYQVQRVDGQWRLAVVPPGLRLTAADRDRSFAPVAVYYPGQVPESGSPRLVPDRVFLQTGPGLAERLVRRVLAAPTTALAGAVAHQPGLSVRSVRTDSAGVVTVDLSGARDLPPEARQTLSAQLVWTLRDLGTGFSGLRLLAGGSPLSVPGVGAVQDDGAWDEYDPEGLGATPPYLFVASRRLRASGLTLPSNAATAGDAGQGNALAVDDVALTPDRTQVALLEGTAPGVVTVRLGPLRGPAYRTAVTARDLRSPSWGSGDRGLWLVRNRSTVALLPPGGRALQDVPVMDRPAGRLNALSASRDGARIALVYGTTLYVGRVEVTAAGPRVAGLRRLDAGGTAVSDVAWVNGTSLAAVGLGRTAAGALAQVARLGVDGSALEVRSIGTLVPESLTASDAGVLLGAGDVLYSLTGRLPARLGAGSRPAYPG